jgi:hypothetical protein
VPVNTIEATNAIFIAQWNVYETMLLYLQEDDRKIMARPFRNQFRP